MYIRTKHWLTDETWSTCDDAHGGVFLRIMPPGAPTLMKPSSMDKRKWDGVKSSFPTNKHKAKQMVELFYDPS